MSADRKKKLRKRAEKAKQRQKSRSPREPRQSRLVALAPFAGTKILPRLYGPGVLLIDRIRGDGRLACHLASPLRPNELPVVYVLDREAARLASDLQEGCGEQWVDDATQESPDAVRLPHPLVWVEYPVGAAGDRAGFMLESLDTPELRFAAGIRDNASSPWRMSYAVVGSCFGWNQTTGSEVRFGRHVLMIWQNEGDWELCGGLADDEGGDGGYLSDVIKGFMRLLTVPRLLETTDVAAPLPHKAVRVVIPPEPDHVGDDADTDAA